MKKFEAVIVVSNPSNLIVDSTMLRSLVETFDQVRLKFGVNSTLFILEGVTEDTDGSALPDTIMDIFGKRTPGWTLEEIFYP